LNCKTTFSRKDVLSKHIKKYCKAKKLDEDKLIDDKIKMFEEKILFEKKS